MGAGERATIRDFIVSNFLFGDASRMPADDQDLLLAGIIDSTGILELIEFLESSFNIQVLDTETVPGNRLFPDEGVGDAAAVVGGRGASVPG
ncbi:hypothetical protein SAMN05443377_1181 [Propionibacterium cyclohexanicum]|uniref:Acyl carrier protein n=1 Tax=Propionibacterium cyclohexanicum TaxID=64702 RepID=A0A1H9T2F8_9ACTN|nr:acyl carrier protein [Propionibacterium cyclohexanicum]SER91184.1 hypothetical protein SAMN05443377_1181 [Propionibacterium cyclohexanicum]